MDKVNIGITIQIKDETESFFTNGIKQNAIILRDTFNKIDFVDNVYFINLGKQKEYSKSPWKEYEPWIIDFDKALECVNVMISVTVFMTDQQIETVHAKNIKLVNHVMGNEYYAFLENVLFKEDQISIIRRTPHSSATWLSPHLYETNKDMFEVLYNAPAYVAPYIWSPKFLMHHVEELKKNGNSDLYKPSGIKEKRISVFEPNIQMNKTSIFPIIIAEKLYRKAPDLIKKVSIFGSAHIKAKKSFVDFAIKLDCNIGKKLFFESRYPIAWSLLTHSDIVLSHQQDLALNYLYFDAAWLGFPVIHNAQFVKELGWYYDRYEADVAVKHLYEVIKIFDNVPGYREEYIKNSREYISKFLPEHERNVKGYEELIKKLFES